jgi:hypothetical protein
MSQRRKRKADVFNGSWCSSVNTVKTLSAGRHYTIRVHTEHFYLCATHSYLDSIGMVNVEQNKAIYDT